LKAAGFVVGHPAVLSAAIRNTTLEIPGVRFILPHAAQQA